MYPPFGFRQTFIFGNLLPSNLFQPLKKKTRRNDKILSEYIRAVGKSKQCTSRTQTFRNGVFFSALLPLPLNRFQQESDR